MQNQEINCNQENASRIAIIENLELINDQQYQVLVRLQTNKEFCSECAAGRGCGAIYLNQLTPNGRNKNLTELKIAKDIVETHRLIPGTQIIIKASYNDYKKSIALLYVLPLLFTIIAPIYIAKILFNLHDLVTVGIAGLLNVAYYYLIHKLYKNYRSDIKYLGLAPQGKLEDDTESQVNIMLSKSKYK